jgi:hypothetical protein
MRLPFRPAVFVLLLFASAILPAAVASADDESGDVVPQDPAAQRRMRQARLAYYRSTTVEAYNRVGRKNPKWDGPARKALEAAAEFWTLNSMAYCDHLRDIADNARAAVAAGCDDPLIRYLYAGRRYGYRQEWDGDDRMRDLAEAGAALAASPYPAARRANGLVNAAAGKATTEADDDARREGRRLVDAAFALLPEVLRDPGPAARSTAFEAGRAGLSSLAILDNRDWEPGVERLRKALVGSPRAEALAECLAGHA